MAYNYPVYQPIFAQQYPNYQAVTPTTNGQNSGIIWVQGEQAAKSYLVPPNSTVQLWDSEKQVIYLKSADGSGMPSMKVLDYTVRDAQKAVDGVSAGKTEYATHDEIKAIYGQINDLKADLEALRKKRKEKDE